MGDGEGFAEFSGSVTFDDRTVQQRMAPTNITHPLSMNLDPTAT
jgi:hypothetical protein